MMLPHMAPAIGSGIRMPGLSPVHQPVLSRHVPSMVPHRDYGGAVGMTPGLQPSNANASPNVQGYVQRFSAMQPEQLQELIARLGNSPLSGLAQSVLQQKRIMAQAPTYQQTAQQTPLPGQAQGAPQVQQAARGGEARPGTVPILAAGGEFVIAPHHVARMGDGDVKEGHRRLDRWVVEQREKIIRTMKSLKPPVKS